MKKEIHTHCKYQKCGKKLPYPSTSVHFCRNNNKCKNDHHNSIRKAKTDLADSIIVNSIESIELENKLNTLLNKRRIRIIQLHDLELMGIDISSPHFKLLNMHDENDELIEFEFVNFQLHYFVSTNEVGIWKNMVA